MNEYRIETISENFTVNAEDSDMCAIAAAEYAKERHILAQRAKMILIDEKIGDLPLGEFDLDGVVLPKNWKEVKALVSEAYQAAKQDAVSSWGYPVHRSRGAFIWFEDEKGNNIYQESEHVQMPATKKEYEVLLSEVKKEHPNVQRAFVSVGIDSASSLHALNNFEDYTPWSGEADRLIHQF